MSAPTQGGATPMQRERATTIFEKGAAGRRAFRDAFSQAFSFPRASSIHQPEPPPWL